MSQNEINKEREKTTVLTVRIEEKLDKILNGMKSKKGISKANVIRNYLEKARYIEINHNSIRTFDDRDLIVIRRKTFKKFLESFEEVQQMVWGIKIARFINDLARYKRKLEDIEYKLDLCEQLGFFIKIIDDDNYILFSKTFGPDKFAESFAYKLIHYNLEDSYDISFTNEAIESSSKLRGQYNKKIGPVDRNKSYYTFEFAKLEK